MSFKKPWLQFMQIDMHAYNILAIVNMHSYIYPKPYNIHPSMHSYTSCTRTCMILTCVHEYTQRPINIHPYIRRVRRHRTRQNNRSVIRSDKVILRAHEMRNGRELYLYLGRSLTQIYNNTQRQCVLTHIPNIQ